MSDRGIHPDLIDDEQAQGTAAETPSPPRRGRAARAAPASSGPPQEPASDLPAAQDSESVSETPTPPEAEATAEPPEWWQQVKDAASKDTPDAEAMLTTLLKNLPIDELEKHPSIRHWIGDMGDRRARALLRQQEQQRIEQQKREALANADFYGLGQLAAPEVQQQLDQSTSAEQYAPLTSAVARFQSTLEPEVQTQVQGKTYGAGKTYEEGIAEYLGATVEAAVTHRLADAVEQELKRREPALRKAFLSELNGGQPVPELDGGRAASSREITDEQVGRMTLAEYDTYFDEHGQPRPGTRVRLTRGIPLTRR